MPSHPSWQLLKHRQSAVVLQVLVEADAKPALSQDAIDRAVPLGLILNEIATNSIKHAFGPEGGGRITVKPVAGVGYGEARLSVADNDRGVKKDNPKGTGLNSWQRWLARSAAPSIRTAPMKVLRRASPFR
jgi:two-component sensor histidine kinase